MGLPVPPTPTGDERLAEIHAARERLTEEEQAPSGPVGGAPRMDAEEDVLLVVLLF